VEVVSWAELEGVGVGWEKREDIGKRAGDVKEFLDLDRVSIADECGEGSIPVRCRGPPCCFVRIERSLTRGPGKYPLGIGRSCLGHRNSNSNNHSACSIARPSFEAIAG
jgi:hypothetical protein